MTRTDGGRPRPACPAEGCGFHHYGDFSIGVGAVVLRGDRVLLIERRTPNRTFWQTPGGYVEIDEEIHTAVERAGGPVYARGAGAALPFPDATFDGVIACLVFEHIEAVDTAIAEVARVLRPDGVFLFLLNHPLLQAPGSGWIDDHILEEQYWRIGPYLVESFEEEEIAPGVHLPFIHRPMSRYVNSLAANGLLVHRMLEPPPPAGFLARAVEYPAAASIPRLLVLRAQRH